jgi:hypothetical protein
MTSPGPVDEHARRAAATYGAAADHYGLPALSFWDRFGAATVSRLRLAPGHRVLDPLEPPLAQARSFVTGP